MKTKVFLVKQPNSYDLWAKRPSERDGILCCDGRTLLAMDLCPRLSKKYFGLKKHLNYHQILEGTMEFKFKEK